ncbi:hypothetical protein E4U21_000820 [Claviceps maximensis]|nr:hypothetical protein E4U21_000820 [Claviceps maximensis]
MHITEHVTTITRTVVTCDGGYSPGLQHDSSTYLCMWCDGRVSHGQSAISTQVQVQAQAREQKQKQDNGAGQSLEARINDPFGDASMEDLTNGPGLDLLEAGQGGGDWLATTTLDDNLDWYDWQPMQLDEAGGGGVIADTCCDENECYSHGAPEAPPVPSKNLFVEPIETAELGGSAPGFDEAFWIQDTGLSMSNGDRDGNPCMEYTDARGGEYLFPCPPIGWPDLSIAPDLSTEMDGVQDYEAEMALEADASQMMSLDEMPSSEASTSIATEDGDEQHCVPLAAMTELFLQLYSSPKAPDVVELDVSKNKNEEASCTMTHMANNEDEIGVGAGTGVGVGVHDGHGTSSPPPFETPHLDSDEPHLLSPPSSSEHPAAAESQSNACQDDLERAACKRLLMRRTNTQRHWPRLRTTIEQDPGSTDRRAIGADAGILSKHERTRRHGLGQGSWSRRARMKRLRRIR